MSLAAGHIVSWKVLCEKGEWFATVLDRLVIVSPSSSFFSWSSSSWERKSVDKQKTRTFGQCLYTKSSLVRSRTQSRTEEMPRALLRKERRSFRRDDNQSPRSEREALVASGSLPWRCRVPACQCLAFGALVLVLPFSLMLEWRGGYPHALIPL